MHFEAKEFLFDGKAPWTHIGSLSTGVGGILRDEENRPLASRKVAPPAGPTMLPKKWCQTEQERREFERRVQWWLTFYEKAGQQPLGADMIEFYELYGKAVHRIIEQYGLSLGNIRQRQKIYATIGL